MKPKLKHVEALLRTISHNPKLDLLAYFRPRLSEFSWHVVLKSLVVIHRIMNEGPTTFIQSVFKSSHLLNLSNFDDKRSTLAMAMSRLIQLYSEYLIEKATTYDKLKYLGERYSAKENAKWAVELPLDKFFVSLPQFQMQYQKLMDCTPYTEDNEAHAIAASATSLIVKDTFRIYSLLSVQVFKILDSFQQMDKKQSTTSLACVKVYQQQSERTKRWTDVLVKLELADSKLLPKFDSIPSSFLILLEEHIKNLEDETTTLSDLVGDQKKQSKPKKEDKKKEPKEPKEPKETKTPKEPKTPKEEKETKQKKSKRKEEPAAPAPSSTANQTVDIFDILNLSSTTQQQLQPAQPQQSQPQQISKTANPFDPFDDPFSTANASGNSTEGQNMADFDVFSTNSSSKSNNQTQDPFGF